jgi:hypothetical protein
MATLDRHAQTSESPCDQPLEQLLYARMLSWGRHAGLAVLLLSFVVYVTGLLEPLVPLDRLPELWSHPVGTYLQAAGLRGGWDWTTLLQHGDMLGLLGIAILAGCSVLALLAVMPLFHRNAERALMFVCGIEVGLILLAASGLLSAGH